MGTISENFSFKEFEASDTAKKYGICNVITDWRVRDNIVALVDNIIQPLRDAWGKPLTINSGYRCPALNNKVGGVPTSQHVKGEAADVGCPDPLALARLAMSMGLDFDQMIVYPTFVHFSYTEDRKNRGQLLYAASYKGERL